MMTPHDTVPDGAVLAPHHIYLGVAAALLAAWLVSDDRAGREAFVVVAGAGGAAGAFLLAWRWYPTVGASLTLLGLLAALAAVVARPFWARYAWVGLRGLALVGVLVALDDALEHALEVPTPLDVMWSRWLFPVVRWIEASF